MASPLPLASSIVGLTGRGEEIQAQAGLQQAQTLAQGFQGIGNIAAQQQFQSELNKGEETLRRIADELGLDENIKNKLSFFSGSRKAVQAGLDFLEAANDRKKQQEAIATGAGIFAPEASRSRLEAAQAEARTQAGLSPIAEPGETLTPKQKEELQRSTRDISLQKSREEIVGLEDPIAFEAAKQRQEFLTPATDRLTAGQELALKREERIAKQSKVKRRKQVAKAIGIDDKQSLQKAVSDSKSVVNVISDVFKDEEIPGFNPFTSFDALPNSVKQILAAANVRSKDYNNKATRARAKINQFFASYIKFISGTAASDREVDRLKEGLAIGNFNTASQFMRSFNDLIAKERDAVSTRLIDERAVDSESVDEVVNTPGFVMPFDRFKLFPEELIQRVESSENKVGFGGRQTRQPAQTPTATTPEPDTGTGIFDPDVEEILGEF